jgi:hypothetical protein
MKKILLLASACIFTYLLVSCDDEQKPAEKPKIVHENSVEYYTETSRLADGRVVISTKQDIYVKSALLRSTVKYDTLPSLGTETVKLESAGKDTTIQKEYDIYFTLK